MEAQQKTGWFKRESNTILTIAGAVAATLAISTALSNGQAEPNHELTKGEIESVSPEIEPAYDEQDALNELNAANRVEDQGVAVLPASPYHLAITNNFYANLDNKLPINATIPSLKEVVYIHDREASTNFKNYTYRIYNTTNQGVDVKFATYALRSIKLWAENRAVSGINMGNLLTAQVQTDSSLHIMAVVDEIPKYVKGNAYEKVPALTRIQEAYTESWVQQPYQELLEHIYFATEFCQSMIDTSSVKILPGASQNIEPLLNETMRMGHSQDDILQKFSQESTCNGMAVVLASLYSYGNTTYARRILDSKLGLFRDRYFYPELFQPETQAFLKVKQEVNQNPSKIFTTTNNLPTVIKYQR